MSTHRAVLTLFTSAWLVMLLACSGGNKPGTSGSKAPPIPIPELPAGVTYAILSDKPYPQFGKRDLDVQVSKEIDEKAVAALARHLKAVDPATYNRTHICFWLPGQRVGEEQCFATGHFTPDLTVTFPKAKADRRFGKDKKP